MTDFLTVKGLCQEYEGRRALRDLNFSLQQGDFLSLFGPNGAGKSTLLRIIATLSAPSGGSVRVRGFDLLEEPEKFKMQLGVISHQSLLYEHMTALENLIFYGSLYNVSDPEARANELLKLVDLFPRRHSQVAKFSRGMRQRLSIARALVNDPTLLLLDEPFSGLDQSASIILQEQLLELRQRKRTVIMVTHNLALGLAIATKTGVLAKGRLVYFEKSQHIDHSSFEQLYLQYVQGEPGVSRGSVSRGSA